jgi:hypothetical protein
MTKQTASSVSVVTLVALPFCLGITLISTKTSAGSRLLNNQTTPKQDEKPFDQAQALADLRKTIA